MSRLIWDKYEERIYEYGVDHGVLYPIEKGVYGKGVVWNGLITVNENPSGAEDNEQYADNMVYLNLKSAEKFGGSIECFTYPDEFAACNGERELVPGVYVEQQRRQRFGFSYRTNIGETFDENRGYKLNIVYGAAASPSEKARNTVNESPEAATFTFEFSTVGIAVEGFRPIAHLVIDSTKTDKTKLAALEKILYGTDSDDPDSDDAILGTDARLPLPEEIATLLKVA